MPASFDLQHQDRRPTLGWLCDFLCERFALRTPEIMMQLTHICCAARCRDHATRKQTSQRANAHILARECVCVRIGTRDLAIRTTPICCYTVLIYCVYSSNDSKQQQQHHQQTPPLHSTGNSQCSTLWPTYGHLYIHTHTCSHTR